MFILYIIFIYCGLQIIGFQFGGCQYIIWKERYNLIVGAISHIDLNFFPYTVVKVFICFLFYGVNLLNWKFFFFLNIFFPTYWLFTDVFVLCLRSLIKLKVSNLAFVLHIWKYLLCEQKPLIIHFLIMRISKKKKNSLSNPNTWHSNAHGSMSTPHLILVFLLN